MLSDNVYVHVNADFDTSGNILPRSIVWEDGHTYSIDRVLDMKPSFSAKAGGCGDMYLVRIRGTECHLFFEHSSSDRSLAMGRWFMARA